MSVLLGLSGALIDANYNIQVVVTTQNLQLNNTDWHVILNPAGTIASLTVTLCISPFDGQIVNIRTSHIITTLSIVTGAGTIVGAPTTLALGAVTEGIYVAANTSWYF
jgi:hypothetical protein